ncbi:5-methylcytosine-specific restriction endonuclease system specificity protein McrC [uncultured Ellagibacter sp.]|uniref:5-methylcytosine-specific restriction endonuclease system specificity protein McrC n=1 Tax=uncultured Ellagibacter sp. TaxID=2137580 RepID=UPI0026221B68|nr:5-methylcytosine-specific restriction endonuclease system specificity protein McrC [uncultured Ellagibacter sp.]
MLAYAFSVLTERGWRDVAAEDFDNAAELCAAILERGIASQVKRGLGREYVGRTEALSSLRGKVEITESVKSQVLLRRQMVCSYDEFSVDSKMNRAIKATVSALVRSDISKARKKSLKKLMVFFADVEQVDLHAVDWSMRYDRNNRTYRMLMAVCWLVAKGLLQTQTDGTTRMMDFLDEQRMCRLYEKFLLEYYRKEHPELSANASYIGWALDDDFSGALPTMHSDIMLSQGGRVLIIDAKYYAHTMQQQFDKRTIHSSNLYQIFAYVKNKEAELAAAGADHEVSGMLLYAKTDEDVQPDGTYQMSGNRISVKTLDLNQPFDVICSQLDAIAEAHFGKLAR